MSKTISKKFGKPLDELQETLKGFGRLERL
jgi:hypothetical protein